MSLQCLTPPTPSMLIEVCVSSLDDAGAARLELCAALEVGGLTPSIGLIEKVIAAIDKPVMIMTRPRMGNFMFNEGNFTTMLADVRAVREAGAAGAVFGVLDRQGLVDSERVKRLVDATKGMKAVFHRAIDGVDTIRRMLARAAGRIQILPGGGVRATNVQQLVETTSCDQVHFGPSVGVRSVAFAAFDGLILASMAMLSSNAYRELDAVAVREVVDEIAAASHSDGKASLL